MGGPDDFNERSPLWMRQAKKLPRWTAVRNILLVSLVLGLALGFIITAVKTGGSVSTYFCIASVSLLLIKKYMGFDEKVTKMSLSSQSFQRIQCLHSGLFESQSITTDLHKILLN
jgi:hypothetical protein